MEREIEHPNNSESGVVGETKEVLANRIRCAYPDLSAAALNYIRNEAIQRGLTFAAMYEEYRQHEAIVDNLMPPLEVLDEAPVPVPKEWQEDAAWDDHVAQNS